MFSELVRLRKNFRNIKLTMKQEDNRRALQFHKFISNLQECDETKTVQLQVTTKSFNVCTI